MHLDLIHPDAPLSPVTQEEYEAGKAWVVNFITNLDALNPELACDSFTDDFTVAWGNNAPIKGQGQGRKLFVWHASTADAFEHSIHSILVLQDRIIVESTSNFAFKNGTQKTVKNATVYAKGINDTKASGAYYYGDYSDVIPTIATIAGPLSLD